MTLVTVFPCHTESLEVSRSVRNQRGTRKGNKVLRLLHRRSRGIIVTIFCEKIQACGFYVRYCT